jgi:predicted transposase/invertase (TIGR01784 family)
MIQTIIIYKFPNMSMEEIQAMFGLSDIQQTKVYQEGVEEGTRREKFRTVPKLLALGLTIQQIAKALGLDVEQVKQIAQHSLEQSGS